MSEDNKDDITFWERAQETFKIVIMDEETFQEVRSYRLSRLSSKLPDIKSLNRTSSTENIELSGAQVAETTRSLKLDQLTFVPPVRGSVSAKYAPERDHQGIDIIAAKNTPIQSTMQGIVVSSDWTMEAGNTIIVQQKNNN